MALLDVNDLHVSFWTRQGEVQAVRGAMLNVEEGEILGLVGESGSGKSTLVRSILRVLPEGADITSGSVTFEGQELTTLSEREMRVVRGREIAMIPQNPATSLNPVLTVGNQLRRTLRTHRRLKGSGLQDKALDMLDQMVIPDPKRVMNSFPHELSGGMQQRSTGAVALSGDPKLLLADEPTTALDATVQAQYLALLKRLQEERGVAIVFVTHDLGIVATMCHRVAVMYAGEIVETAPTKQLFEDPQHPYTEALINSIPPLNETVGKLRTIEGQPPRLNRPIIGCPFAPRCSYVMDRCREEVPPVTGDSEHLSRCWRHV